MDHEFVIMEQADGRYLLIVKPRKTGMGYNSRGETLIHWEDECRNTLDCYAAVNEYMMSSGEYLDTAAKITYVRYPVTD